ncbi:MAG: hypothetical protein V1717_03155 [Candidatus Micrarchaeota archaeon]
MKNMSRLSQIVLLSLLLFSLMPVAFALSSEEALAKAKPYLDVGITPLPKQLFALSDYYYAYSPSIYSSQKIFIAVADSTGEIETNEARLTAVGAAVYNYGVLNEYVQRNKISFEDLETTVRQTLSAVDQNIGTLAALEVKTKQSYPDESFDNIESKAYALQTQALDLNSLVSDGVGVEKQFEGDFSDLSLSVLLSYYKNAFLKAQEFIDAYDEYNNAISQKQTDVFKSDIPAPDNENIVKNLENMRLKVDLFENLRFLKPSEGIEKLENARDKWVNESIASFNYKKMTFDVKAKYSEVETLVNYVYSGEASLVRCGLQEEGEAIKTRWREVQLLMERGRSSDLQILPARLDAIKTEFNSLKSKVDSCSGGGSISEPYLEQPSSQTNYLPWLVAIVLAAGAYLYWRYKQENEETYS